jgi:predicted nucleic acid-binding protein
MIVIADATPLNYLILIEQAEILPQLFNEIVIPTAVVTELRRPQAPASVRTWIAAPPTWLSVRSAVPRPTPELDRLGAGEREAILLGEELKADWLIIDDQVGRHEATRRHLPVIGTLRVLDEAAGRSLLDLRAALERLQQTSFHISPDLVTWLLDRDAERRRPM